MNQPSENAASDILTNQMTATVKEELTFCSGDRVL